MGGEVAGGEATQSRMDHQALALTRVLSEPEIQDAVRKYGRETGTGIIAHRVGKDGVGITCKLLDICLITDDGERLLPRHPTTVFHVTTGAPNFERDPLGKIPDGQALLSIRMIPPEPNLQGLTSDGPGGFVNGLSGEPGSPEYQFYLERSGDSAPANPEELPKQLAGLVTPEDVMHGALTTVSTIKK